MTTLTKNISDKLGSLKKLQSSDEMLTSLKISILNSNNKIDKLLIMLLDCSYSMDGDMGKSTKTDVAWKVFRTNLIPNLSNWKFGMLTFADESNWHIKPGDDVSSVRQPSLQGGTGLGEVLTVAWKYIREHVDSSRIILLTDGEPTDMSKEGILTLTKFHCGIPIDTIAVGKKGNYDPTFLRELSEMTGGIFCEANSVDTLTTIITKLSPIHRPLLGRPA